VRTIWSPVTRCTSGEAAAINLQRINEVNSFVGAVMSDPVLVSPLQHYTTTLHYTTLHYTTTNLSTQTLRHLFNRSFKPEVGGRNDLKSSSSQWPLTITRARDTKQKLLSG